MRRKSINICLTKSISTVGWTAQYRGSHVRDQGGRQRQGPLVILDPMVTVLFESANSHKDLSKSLRCLRQEAISFSQCPLKEDNYKSFSKNPSRFNQSSFTFFATTP